MKASIKGCLIDGLKIEQDFSKKTARERRENVRPRVVQGA
jgi:hypothetical protein